MNTSTGNGIRDRHLLIAVIVILFLSLIGQCNTSRKCSTLQDQNEVLTKQVQDVSKNALTQEQLKTALQESMYQTLTIQEQVNKGKITAEQMQKNLSEIKKNISEIKKTSENEGSH